MNQKVVKSKANAVVASLAKVARPIESGQGDGTAMAGGMKENLIPYAFGRFDLNSHKGKEKRTNLGGHNARNGIHQSVWIWRTGRLQNLTNQHGPDETGETIWCVEYSRITVPDLVHMGNPAGGYVEMLKVMNSARGHLMA